MKNKFDSASLKVTSALWPAYLYPGNIPGKDFDPEDIIEGLFRGYLLERVHFLFVKKHLLLIYYAGHQAYIYISIIAGRCY